MAEKISPYTGNLTSLLAFQDAMKDFYSEFYGEDGIVRARVNDLTQPTGPPNRYSWTQRLLFHNGTSSDGAMSTIDVNSFPRPLDITQQQDVEVFSEWDITIETYEYDEICNAELIEA